MWYHYQLYKEQCRSPSVCDVLEDTPPEESKWEQYSHHRAAGHWHRSCVTQVRGTAGVLEAGKFGKFLSDVAVITIRVLYTLPVCVATLKKNMKSQRVMEMVVPFWHFVKITERLFFLKYEWADTSFVDGHAGIIIVAVSNFRACARVVLTMVTFNCRA